MTVSVLCFFFAVTWIGLQCVIVELPGHNHFLFSVLCNAAQLWFIYFDDYLGGLCIWNCLLSFKNTTKLPYPYKTQISTLSCKR